MKADKQLLNFMLTGLLDELPFGALTTRMDLQRRYKTLEGLNKIQGAYEFMYAENMLLYLGPGTRGALEGILFFELETDRIGLNDLKKELAEKGIFFEEHSANALTRIETTQGVNLIFKQLDDALILSYAYRLKNQETLAKMLKAVVERNPIRS